MAALGASAFEHHAAILGLHAAKKPVGLGTTAIIGLESALHRPPQKPAPDGKGEPSSLPVVSGILKPKELPCPKAGVLKYGSSRHPNRAIPPS